MRSQNFDVTIIPPETGGYVAPRRIEAALRADTLLVSVMHVNNETGVEQPLPEICAALANHAAYLHVDAAQGFGKRNDPLRQARIDLLSISAHKMYGPKGIGTLVMRRRGIERPPLSPLMFGGGQERGLRPGTLPVPLIVGMGVAAELAVKDSGSRQRKCCVYRERVLRGLAPLDPQFNGDQDRVLPHVLNIAIPGLDAEAFMLATKELIAVSNGSACTSQSYQPSHVLKAMRLPQDLIQSSLRLSWCHMTSDVDWESVVAAVDRIR
jgi:cysteine desulfurase